MKISQYNLNLLQRVSKEFSVNLKNTHSDALKVFQSNMRFKDYFTVMSAKALQNIPTPSRNVEGRRLVRYHSAVLPVLTRSFGEVAVIKALPLEAGTERMISLCQSLGGNDLAVLCRKKATGHTREHE